MIPTGAAAGLRPPRSVRSQRPGGTGRPCDSGEAARVSNVEAPRGDLGRDSGAPLPPPPLGLGRQGARDSRDAA